MQLSAIIIAGGKSSRMGSDKTKMIYRGQSLLQKAMELAGHFSADVIISSNGQVNTNAELSVFADEIPDIGPLGGLYTCLKHIKNRKTLVLPADMPLLDKNVLEYLIKKADFQKDVNIFQVEGRRHPLVGIYDQNLLPLIEKQIADKDYKLRNLLQKSAFHLIDGSSFTAKFININTPDEWAKLQANNE